MHFKILNLIRDQLLLSIGTFLSVLLIYLVQKLQKTKNLIIGPPDAPNITYPKSG